jgi:hypothetical protein
VTCTRSVRAAFPSAHQVREAWSDASAFAGDASEVVGRNAGVAFDAMSEVRGWPGEVVMCAFDHFIRARRLRPTTQMRAIILPSDP